MYLVDQAGSCPICEASVRFTAKHEWYRDHLLCSGCGSIPRERVLMHVIQMYYPNYRELKVHESSPGNRGVSPKLQRECNEYSTSHFFPSIGLGEIDQSTGYQCQDLENLLFEDESFDLFITQDVMEHIFDPSKAFKEIARVLKPGGAHVFTVPIINKGAITECWASKDQLGEVVFHQEPEYHGNPIDNSGSLVTMHWGWDIAEFIQRESSCATTIVAIDNMHMGIRAEYIEVLVSRKSLGVD